MRFIPARAGNATVEDGKKIAQTVHPRAGGERRPADCPGLVPNGSSPRGRGTPRLFVCHSVVSRFIPARAGNALPALGTDDRFPVHPRAGGERTLPGSTMVSAVGSSPRGRGTLSRPRRGLIYCRFIPARAGNAVFWCGVWPFLTVHPRAGGERIRVESRIRRIAGSSPRGRGTRARRSGFRALRRFIPARAGNAVAVKVRVGPRPVHPRAGGERRRGRQRN